MSLVLAPPRVMYTSGPEAGSCIAVVSLPSKSSFWMAWIWTLTPVFFSNALAISSQYCLPSPAVALCQNVMVLSSLAPALEPQAPMPNMVATARVAAAMVLNFIVFSLLTKSSSTK